MPLTLKNVSLSIQGGEKIGIVGRTGSGVEAFVFETFCSFSYYSSHQKSTLVCALFRIVEGQRLSSVREHGDEPCISIDGIDIGKIGLNELRSRMAIIPQDCLLFSGSLRFNLSPFGLHSDSQLWDALSRVQMSALVKTLPVSLIKFCSSPPF